MTTSANPKQSEGSQKSERKVRLRTTLVVPFVLQILASVSLVGYLSFRNGQLAVNSLVDRLQNEIVSRINLRLNTYLDTPHKINQLNVDAVKLGLNPTDFSLMEQHFWRQMKLFDNVSYISLGTERGRFMGVQRIDGDEMSAEVKDETTGVDKKAYPLNQQGERLPEVIGTSENYEPTQRAWYKAAKEAGQETWTDIYQLSSDVSVRLSITAVQPLYDSQDNLVGVFGVDLIISQISDFMRQVKVSKSGKSFVMERDGLLVASSSDSPPLAIDAENNGVRLKAAEFEDPLIRETARYLEQKFSNLNQIKQSQQIDFKLNGVRQFVQVIPWQDRFGLDWLIVVVIPESDFMEQISKNTRNTIFLCLLALGLAILIGILTARWVTRPILRISHVSDQLAQGELDRRVQPSRIVEINTLSTSFNRMASQLKEFFDTLEDKVTERTAELAGANKEITLLNEKLKDENLRMGAELNIARQLQQMVLPKPEELENIEGIEIAGFMEPADEVGGDYYDVLATDGVVTIGIGDVTGHGLESGILMLMTQTAVRTLKEVQEKDPIRFLDTLNRTLYRNVQRMDSEKNLTLAILNYSQGKVSISGQHEETIVVRAGGEIEMIDMMDLGLPIGMDDDISDFLDHTIVELHSGDGIVLYTDGIPEAFNMEKKQYGMKRLCDVISKNWQLTAEEIKQAIINDVREFIGKQKVFDDITLLVLKQN